MPSALARTSHSINCQLMPCKKVTLSNQNERYKRCCIRMYRIINVILLATVGFILQNKLEKYKITKRLEIAFVVKLCYIFRHEFHAVTMKGWKWNMS